MTMPSVGDPVPPRWMNRVLRTLVRRGDEGTIEGDLLEEYGEEVLPRAGRVRANLWYLRQVLSFVRFSFPAVAGGVAWMACGTLLFFVAMDSVLARDYGPGSVAGVSILVAEVAFVLNALAALRSTRIAVLWRNSLVFGVLIGLLLGIRYVLGALAGRGSFATLGTDIEIGEVLIGLVLAAGVWGGWRLGKFRAGVLVALSAGAIGWLVSLVMVAGVAVLFPGRFTDVFFRNEAVFGKASDIVRAAAVLGTIGGMFARGLRGFALDRRQFARPR